jgi:hypothetical protein
MRCYLLVAMVVLSPVVAMSGTGDACLTTLPPNPAFVPPAPYDAESPATFWYGTDALWTQLAADGVWHLANNSDKNNGYVTKLLFWRKGFDWRKEPQPDLIITAHRTDGDSPSVAVAHANAVFITGNKPAIMTGLRIPTSGCWEITAHYGGHTLTFVTLVEP